MPKISRRRTHSFHIQGKIRSTTNELQESSELNDDDYTFSDNSNINFQDESVTFDIGDLFELCKKECGSRKLGVLLYIVLRHFGIFWRRIDQFMMKVGGLRCFSAHKCTTTFIEGNYEDFIKDDRGGKKKDSFYDAYPELEIEAKAFVINGCNQKTAEFTAAHLAMFLDEKFY